MLAKPALTDAPLHDLLRRLWSTRAFDAVRPVAGTDLRTILEAARSAPSGNNSQPARYLLLDREADAAAWQKGFAPAKAREAFAMSQNDTPITMIAVGYQADPSVLGDDVKPKELASRSRKPLGEVCCTGAWGRAVA